MYTDLMASGPQGMELDQFQRTLADRAAAAQDFVMKSTQLNIVGQHELEIEGIGQYRMSDLFHRQLATRTGTPIKFYERARDEFAPEFLPLLNKLLAAGDGSMMVRTLKDPGQGLARALLSSSYRRIDNHDIAPVVVDTVQELGQFLVKSANISDTKMYLKFIFPQIRADVKVGDTVESGIIVSNSEVGMGSFNVQPFVHRLVCLNGMVIPDAGMKRRHVGRNQLDGEAAHELFAADTLAAENQALLLKVRDLIRASANPEHFEGVVSRFREAADDVAKDKPEKRVEALASTYGLNQDERDGVLRNLFGGQDLSRWGWANAVTATAKEAGDYDRAVELESLGGRIIDLSPTQWKKVV